MEIESLAEPIPSSNQKIKTYIEEVYPEVFEESIEVVAVDSLRTFYEKLTILHREANRMNGNLKLIPSKDGLAIFSKDYDSTKNMLFGEKIAFDKIIDTLKEYEKELNVVIKINKHNLNIGDREQLSPIFRRMM